MKLGIVFLSGAVVFFMLFFVNALAERPHETAANVFALFGAILFLSALYRFAQALKRVEAEREADEKR